MFHLDGEFTVVAEEKLTDDANCIFAPTISFNLSQYTTRYNSNGRTGLVAR